MKNTDCFKCKMEKPADAEVIKIKEGEKAERKNMGWKCLDASCGFPMNF